MKAPGEKSHKNLRWEVKAQMMYKEEPAPVCTVQICFVIYSSLVQRQKYET